MDSKFKKEEQGPTSSLARFPSVFPEGKPREKSLTAPDMESLAPIMTESTPTHQQSQAQHGFGKKDASKIIRGKNKTINKQRRKIKQLGRNLEEAKKCHSVVQDSRSARLRAEVERLNNALSLKEEKIRGDQDYNSYLETSLSNCRGQLDAAEEINLQEAQRTQVLQEQLSQQEAGYQGAIQKLQTNIINLQKDILSLQNNNKKLKSQADGKEGAHRKDQVARMHKQDTALKKNSDAKSFFQWKAEGARMIEDMIGVDKRKLKRMADEQAATFYLFVPRHRVHHKTAMERLFKNLCNVIEDALSLHKIFMTSKAHFTLDRPQATGRGRLTRYDSEWMDAESWVKDPLDNRSSLKFPISPGLVKHGTADGEHYDQQLRLVKARVACN
ncbi:hypothetical protein COL922a_006415 [Colletotrichum nupharicola]|nr:hypothetical protein COL922a_006415 [Colletotrichum nupharicola]